MRPNLVKGKGGVFEVVLENEVLFSKQREGRFPQPGEVEEAIELRLGAEAKQGPFTTG